MEECDEEHVALVKHLEVTKQELHEYKKKAQTYEAVQRELMQEVDCFQQDKIALEKQYKERLAVFEEKCELKDSKILLLENAIADLEEAAKSKQDISQDVTPVNRESSSGLKSDELDLLIKEIECLKEENEILNIENKELQEGLAESLRKQCVFEEHTTDLKNEIEGLRETLSCKREELNEANNLIQNMQDELFCYKAELESLKSRPLDTQSQGNSLFAEVNDRRVELQSQVKKMKTNYVVMKKENTAFLNEIKILRNEKFKLIQKIETDMDQMEIDESKTVAAQRATIAELEKIVENLQKQVSELTTLPKDILSKRGMNIYWEETIKNKQAEIAQLHERITSLSLGRNILTTKVADLNKVNRKLELQIIKLENEVELLKAQNEANIKSPTEINENDFEPREPHKLPTAFTDDQKIQEQSFEAKKSIPEQFQILTLKETNIVEERMPSSEIDKENCSAQDLEEKENLFEPPKTRKVRFGDDFKDEPRTSNVTTRTSKSGIKRTVIKPTYFTFNLD